MHPVGAPADVRRIPLEGAVNFRDLGGYPTADGRRTRWGQLYRSDSLAELTDADIAIVERLGLRTLCDLRHGSERDAKPNRELRGPGPAVHTFGFLPHAADDLVAGARSGALSVQQIRERIREVYRRFVLDRTEVYARLLALLCEPGALPMVVHCTSGRDRTGFAAALVLHAVGVRRQTIAADHALSDEGRRDLTFMLGPGVDPEVVDALTRTHPSYLLAAFEAITEHWGSEEAYLCDGLQLDGQRRRRLEENLLEPAGGAVRSRGR